MIKFSATIMKFDKQGEKTGWTYIMVPTFIAAQLLPRNHKGFRVKGSLDNYKFKGVNLLPMGNGCFIMALNTAVRRKIGKRQGHQVEVELEVDPEPYKIDHDLINCLKEDAQANIFFSSLPKSHQNYFSKWIEAARTEVTKAKRIATTIIALNRKQGFGEMLQAQKSNRKE